MWKGCRTLMFWRHAVSLAQLPRSEAHIFVLMPGFLSESLSLVQNSSPNSQVPVKSPRSQIIFLSIFHIIQLKFRIFSFFSVNFLQYAMGNSHFYHFWCFRGCGGIDRWTDGWIDRQMDTWKLIPTGHWPPPKKGTDQPTDRLTKQGEESRNTRL